MSRGPKATSIDYVAKIIAERRGMEEVDVKEILMEACQIIKEYVMTTGLAIEIKRFGKFFRYRTAPREYVHRHTKERKSVEARDTLKFKWR